jgi:hypothetical protein
MFLIADAVLRYRHPSLVQGTVVRLFLIGGLLLAAPALLSCSSSSTPTNLSRPAWQVANAPQSQYVTEQRIVRQQDPKKTQTARPNVRDEMITGSTPNKNEEFKLLSKEWYQREKEEERRMKAIMTICRGC